MEFEMSSQGIDFSREQEMPVYYKNNQIGMRLVDFLIHRIIAIELKEINYLEASDLDSYKKNQNNPGIK
jgi:GxxExxY protein